MYIHLLGLPFSEAPIRLVWGHGWGQDHTSFLPLAEPLARQAHHVLLDFQGFGQSPKPDQVWGTAEYADDVAAYLKENPFKGKTIWVGHSFGGRVGMQLAARHPALIDGLFLIASAGVPRQRNFKQKVKNKFRVLFFKSLKHLWRWTGRDVDVLKNRFGSPDYRNAGPLRPIFLKTIAENLSEVARAITCPVFLLYGSADTETPPDIGATLRQLIPNATLCVLDGQDHFSILTSGRHQTLKYLQVFVTGVSTVE